MMELPPLIIYADMAFSITAFLSIIRSISSKTEDTKGKNIQQAGFPDGHALWYWSPDSMLMYGRADGVPSSHLTPDWVSHPCT